MIKVDYCWVPKIGRKKKNKIKDLFLILSDIYSFIFDVDRRM